jgi:hypothetical protein
VLIDEVMDQAFLDPVGKAATVKTILQPPLCVVIELRHGRSLGVIPG